MGNKNPLRHFCHKGRFSSESAVPPCLPRALPRNLFILTVTESPGRIGAARRWSSAAIRRDARTLPSLSSDFPQPTLLFFAFSYVVHYSTIPRVVNGGIARIYMSAYPAAGRLSPHCPDCAKKEAKPDTFSGFCLLCTYSYRSGSRPHTGSLDFAAFVKQPLSSFCSEP